MKLGLGILGMGVQGGRMLARLAEHDRLKGAAAWDPDPARLEGAGIARAASPEELVRTPGVDCVYVASPPAAHMAQANLAFDAGRPVLCEKPLAVDAGEARATIARIARERQRGAVNFSLAGSAGLAAVRSLVDGGGLGRLRAVEIEVSFREWPRPWQAQAGRWLAGRREGGFTREVLSHFVFVLQRVLGEATVERSEVAYPPDGIGAEVGLTARLRAGDVPVAIEGRVGGEMADFNRFTLVGEAATLELRDWLATRWDRESGRGEPVDAGGRAGYLRQLDEVAAFIEGRAHRLPDFAEALAVQETIETLLDPRND